jgi:hypothetical protein
MAGKSRFQCCVGGLWRRLWLVKAGFSVVGWVMEKVMAGKSRFQCCVGGLWRKLWLVKAGSVL